MSLPAVYLPNAEDDVAAAHIHYERQRAGLGDNFVEALREAVDRIRNSPRLDGAFRRDIRAAPLKKFPYVVYYRDRGGSVLIIAVQHGRRSSRAWRERGQCSTGRTSPGSRGSALASWSLTRRAYEIDRA